MKILVVGSEARERAIAWKLNESHGVDAQLLEHGNATAAAKDATVLPVEANPLDKADKMKYVVAAYNNAKGDCRGRRARGSHYGQ